MQPMRSIKYRFEKKYVSLQQLRNTFDKQGKQKTVCCYSGEIQKNNDNYVRGVSARGPGGTALFFAFCNDESTDLPFILL